MTLHIHIHRLATPTTTLVRDLVLQVPAGTVHTVMGASGSGKSSLLSAVSGTLADGLVFDGTVHLNGQQIDTLPAQARRVGILFQEDLLFAHMTVRENLLFAVPPGPKSEREAQVLRALVDVEMGPFLHTNPATLSGGQRGRIALARALLAQPRALLLDEPFPKLDAALRTRMRELVFGLVKARNIPVLLVTHDAADVADAAQLTHLSSLDHPTHHA
jgi:putative thiamine transport system ATP-binding protein